MQSHLITGLHARLYDRRMRCYRIGELYNSVIAEMPLTKVDKVLDVGCGTGALLYLLRRKHPSKVHFAGIDASSDMLAQAKKVDPTVFIEFREADASRIPFPDRSFSWVTSLLAFHRMPPDVKARAVSEISRVLEPGGRFLVADLGETRNPVWGMFGALLNFHSYTRGNMRYLQTAMRKHSLVIERVTWHRGVIKQVLARKKD